VYHRPRPTGGHARPTHPSHHPPRTAPVLGRYDLPPATVTAPAVVRVVCQTGLLAAVGVVVAKVASALSPVAFTVLTLAGAVLLFASAGLRWLWAKQVNTTTAAPVVTVAAVLAALVFVFGGGELNLITLVIAVVVASMVFPVTVAADRGLALLGWRASLMAAAAAVLLFVVGWALRAVDVGLVPVAVVIWGLVAVNVAFAVVMASGYAGYVLAHGRRPLAVVTAAGRQWRRAFVCRERWDASPVLRAMGILAAAVAGPWAVATLGYSLPSVGLGSVAAVAGVVASAAVFPRTWATCFRALAVWLTYNAAGRAHHGVYQPAGWFRPAWARRAWFAAVVAFNTFACRAVHAPDDVVVAGTIRTLQPQQLETWPLALIAGELLSVVWPVFLPTVTVFAVAGTGLRRLYSAVERSSRP
jgi:hypothetical protein